MGPSSPALSSNRPGESTMPGGMLNEVGLRHATRMIATILLRMNRAPTQIGSLQLAKWLPAVHPYLHLMVQRRMIAQQELALARHKDRRRLRHHQMLETARGHHTGVHNSTLQAAYARGPLHQKMSGSDGKSRCANARSCNKVPVKGHCLT